MAPRSKAEIEPRFPALQPVSGCEGALLPSRRTQCFRQALEPDGGARQEGSRGQAWVTEEGVKQRRGFSRPCRFLVKERRGQLTHTGQGLF